MLYRLIYMSTAKNLFTENELEDLMEKSKQNNKKIDVTGLLLTKGKTFIQCLEGEKDNVEELYSKIENDDRHDDVIELIEEEIDSRIFTDWSMGYRNIEKVHTINTDKLKEIKLDDIKNLEQSDIYDIFRYFVEN